MTTKARAPWDGTPFSDWADSDQAEQYTSPKALAGWTAWHVLTHSQLLGPDMARVERTQLPKGCAAGDTWEFLNDIVTAAAELGVRFAQIAPSIDPKLTSTDVARALAALEGLAVVEDDQPFDPEYRAKRHAASLVRQDDAA